MRCATSPHTGKEEQAMPPKAKFTREEIIEKTLSVVREKGADAVTAREVAAALGMSSRPIFTWFSSMDELKAGVRAAAEELFQQYVDSGLREKIPFLGVGMNTVRFAKEEPELYKLLFLSPAESGVVTGVSADSRGVVRRGIMDIYRMSAAEADCYFSHLWLTAYSMATMTAMGHRSFSEDEARMIFAQASAACCRAIKEIDGFAQGRFERDKVFMQLISQSSGQ